MSREDKGMRIPVEEAEVEQVLAWAHAHASLGTTEHEEGSYEEGVADAIRWMRGDINARPDQP